MKAKVLALATVCALVVPSLAAPPAPGRRPAKGKFNITLAGVTLKHLTLYISDITGKPVVLPPRFPGDARVDIVSAPNAELDSREAAMSLIAVTLRNAGFALEEHEKYVRVVPDKQAVGTPERAGAKPSLLSREAVVTRVVNVKHAEAEKLAPLLQGLTSPAGSIKVYARTNRLVIKEYASNLKLMLELIGQLDTESPGSVWEICPLKNRSVEGLRTIVESYASAMAKSADALAKKRLTGFRVITYAPSNAFVLVEPTSIPTKTCTA